MNYLVRFLLLALLCAPALAQNPDAATLGRWIHDAERVLRGQTSAAVMSMKIKKASYEREYDLLVMTDDRSESGKVLIRMLGPALWRGNATLKVADRISFFDPRTNRVTVMGSSMLGDNWMGSHFTNDDLMRETDLAKHYRYELLGSQPSNDDGAAATQHRIQLTPLPQAPVAWGKVVYRLTVGADKQVLPVKLEYFRRADDAQPARVLEYSGLNTLGGERKVPTRLTMTVAQSPGEFTQIDYRKLKFDTQFGAEDFTERAFR